MLDGDWDVLFQFLIGTLKTKDLPKIYQQAKEFQFLIGTLKTKLFPGLPNYRTNVSIPDRYAKNQWQNVQCYAKAFVSIPDRYAKNRVKP